MALKLTNSILDFTRGQSATLNAEACGQEHEQAGGDHPGRERVRGREGEGEGERGKEREREWV